MAGWGCGYLVCHRAVEVVGAVLAIGRWFGVCMYALGHYSGRTESCSSAG